MAVGGIDHHHVDARVDQRLGAGQPVRAHAARRSGAQAALFVLAGIREFFGLLDILHRDQADALAVVIDHQQLFDPVLVQQAARLFAIDAFLHRHQPALGHQFLDRLVRIVGKADIAVGQDPDQPVAAPGHNGYSGNAVIGHQ